MKLHIDFARRRAVQIIAIEIGFLIACITMPACKNITVPTGITPNQSVVVDAEKTLSISRATFETFLKLEYQNRDAVKAHWPQIHTFANYLRGHYIDWLLTANKAKDDYKTGKISLSDLQAALSIITTNSTQAAQYTTTIQTP